MYLASVFSAKFDECCILHIVRGTQLDASMAIGAFVRLRDLGCIAMGLSSTIGLPFNRHVDENVPIDVNCSRREISWQDFPLMTCTQAKRYCCRGLPFGGRCRHAPVGRRSSAVMPHV